MDKHTVSLEDQTQQAPPCEGRKKKGQGKPALTQVLTQIMTSQGFFQLGHLKDGGVALGRAHAWP